jgi:hypothetical protein
MTIVLAITVVLAAIAGEWFLAAVYGEDEVRCQQASVPASLPALPEASGIAASRRTPGLLWTINDSGSAVLFGVTEAGATAARVQVTGATITDWEDLSVARCAGGNCLFIADIGDNDAERSSIKLYRVPEPARTETATRPADVFEARYPDGPHDAEAMFVTPDQTVYILTKDAPAGTLYRFPPLETGKVLILERVVAIPMAKATGAGVSQDGVWLAVRTNAEIAFYRMSALLKGDVEPAAIVDVHEYGEPQGEGITFADASTLYLAGESGKKGAPGTLLQVKCSIPSAS